MHNKKTNKFLKTLRNSTQLSKTRTNVAGLVFDFIQNIDMPKIPVHKMYYLRQLTANILCINKLKT